MQRLMDYVVCTGSSTVGDVDKALARLAEQVMKVASERQMVPHGGIHVQVYPGQDDMVGWIAFQTMVRGVA